MTEPKKHTDSHSRPHENTASAWTETLFNGEDPQAKMRQWAQDADRFVRQNPWAAVAGALALGYLAGRLRGRSRGGE